MHTGIHELAQTVPFFALHVAHLRLSLHSCSSASETPELKRAEVRKVPVPACSPAVSPVARVERSLQFISSAV